MNNDNIILVHGIFGSGKSHIITSICVFLKRISIEINKIKASIQSKKKDEYSKMKVLVSANTNVAVDRIMNQLSSFGDNKLSQSSSPSSRVLLARVGRADKIDKKLRKHLVFMSENRINATNELNRLICKEKSNCKDLLKLLEKTKKSNFNDCQRVLLGDADIVGVTCASSAMNNLLRSLNFPILILDEASQIVEPLSLLPIACSKCIKMIIVGDPEQLSAPCANSTTNPHSSSSVLQTNYNSFYTRSLFDRLINLNVKCTILKTQYRCHPRIANICSHLFYNNCLVNGVSSTDRPSLVQGLPTILTLHCAGQDHKLGDSYINHTEATLIRDTFHWLRNKYSNKNNKEDDGNGKILSIGIICLYKAQANIIENYISESIINNNNNNNNKNNDYNSVSLNTQDGLLISTVDAFQGMEMDIIIIATSRQHCTEFINNNARVNVAISRARKYLNYLCIILFSFFL
jgi:superfamily I DNA and/or RNA helicase